MGVIKKIQYGYPTNTKNYYLGIDPDLHTTALAIIDSNQKVMAIEVIRATSLDKMVMAGGYIAKWLDTCLYTLFGSLLPAIRLTCVVEGQESYLGPGRHARVSDLLDLAYVAGACAAVCYASPLVCDVLRPLPKQWKGTIPKKQKQEHICRKLGWKCVGRADYVVPELLLVGSDINIMPDHIKSADWKHLLDAVGMALWASDR